MTYDEYRVRMDQIVQSLGLVGTLTDAIADAELDLMLKTISILDTTACIFGSPLEHGKTIESLDAQRKLIEAVQHVRATLREVGLITEEEAA